MDVQHFFGPFPAIDLGDIILREINKNDVKDYFHYMNHEAMTGFLTQDNRPQNLESATEDVMYWGSLFPSKRSIYWAIALKETNQLLGTAGFNLISFSNSRAEISYDLDPDYWGRGIMLKAVKNILKFADNELKIVRTQATVITDNQRSINLLQRCGFNQEGLLKRYEVVEGEHKDYYLYARVII